MRFGATYKMKLLEYKGKELLSDCGIPIQKGVVVSSEQEVIQKLGSLSGPYVLKVQIMAGGRGKAGGIQFADDASGAKTVSGELLGKEMRGCIVKKVLIAQKVDVKTEWYLSIILDRLNKCPTIIFSSLGGIDIEETAKSAPDKIIKIAVNPLLGIKSYHSQYIFDKSAIDYKFFDSFHKVLCSLYDLFMKYDATLVEINPLAITAQGQLMAIDCKIDIDDSALYRHPDILEFRSSLDENPLVVESRSFNFLYIPLNSEGSIAVSSNGSGMLMSCIDLITKAGKSVGAALDLGGGATAERISEAVKIIFKNKKTDCLFVSIFGGITRCDEVALGVKTAIEGALKDKTVILRLEGTNKARAIEIMKSIKGKVIAADSISQGVEFLCSGKI
jgi:succinyl-CoA synthetase beta subunit